MIRLEQELGHSLPMAELFRGPTIEQVAAQIGRSPCEAPVRFHARRHLSRAGRIRRSSSASRGEHRRPAHALLQLPSVFPLANLSEPSGPTISRLLQLPAVFEPFGPGTRMRSPSRSNGSRETLLRDLRAAFAADGPYIPRRAGRPADTSPTRWACSNSSPRAKRSACFPPCSDTTGPAAFRQLSLASSSCGRSGRSTRRFGFGRRLILVLSAPFARRCNRPGRSAQSWEAVAAAMACRARTPGARSHAVTSSVESDIRATSRSSPPKGP